MAEFADFFQGLAGAFDDSDQPADPTKGASAGTKVGGAVGNGLAGAMDILGGIQSEQQYFTQGTRYRQEAKLDLYNAGKEVAAHDRAAQADISATDAISGSSGVTGGGSVAAAQRAVVNQATTADVASRYAGKIKNIEDLYEAQQQDYAGKQAFMGGLISGGMKFAETAAMLA